MFALYLAVILTAVLGAAFTIALWSYLRRNTVFYGSK